MGLIGLYNSIINQLDLATKGNEMSKQNLIDQVTKLVKTKTNPYNSTTLDEWIEEGDMTPEEIAQAWDELVEYDKWKWGANRPRDSKPHEGGHLNQAGGCCCSTCGNTCGFHPDWS